MGQDRAAWTQEVEFQAGIIDRLSDVLFVLQRAPHFKTYPSEPYERVKRPFEVEKPKRKSIGLREFADLMRGK